MPIDSALLASLEGPNQFETLKQTVEANPEDFTAWGELLSKLEDQDIDTIRHYFDTFLERFPLCYGYWKKYCDYETKHGSLQDLETVERVKSIWLRGVEAAPYCVDMWIYFMSFASVYLLSEAREYFQKAVSYVGTDPKSNKLWDSYIMFESSCNTPETVAALYSQILSTPFRDVKSYWEPFMAFASQQTVQVLATPEEMKVLESAYEEDASSRMLSDEEKLYSLKRMLIDLRKATFETTLKMAETRDAFERKIKRQYFHVKALGQSDLANWRSYLDFEMIHGNVNSITVLFERCLIPCALYEEFWLRYAEWSHIARDQHATTLIVDRCLQTYLPKSVPLLLLRAQLLEESGDVEATKQHLEKVMTKDCPQLLEAAIFYVELMLRHDDRDGAEEMMEQLATEDYGLEANAFIALYTANYYWKVRKDYSRARSVFADNKTRCAGSLAFWKYYLNFEYSIAEQPYEAIHALLKECLEMTRMMYSDKLTFYELYIQYASTLCTSVKDLLQMKADFAVWKLAASAENTAEQEQRTSQKRDSSAMTGAAGAATTTAVAAAVPATPAVATTPVPAVAAATTPMQNGMAMMGGIPTDPTSPEYAQYYYQYYQYYGYQQNAASTVQQ